MPTAVSGDSYLRGFTFTSEQPNCACSNGDQLLHNRASPVKYRACVFNMQWMTPSSPKQWEHFHAVWENGNSILKFRCLWKWYGLSFRPWFSKQSSPNKEPMINFSLCIWHVWHFWIWSIIHKLNLVGFCFISSPSNYSVEQFETFKKSILSTVVDQSSLIKHKSWIEDLQFPQKPTVLSLKKPQRMHYLLRIFYRGKSERPREVKGFDPRS